LEIKFRKGFTALSFWLWQIQRIQSREDYKYIRRIKVRRKLKEENYMKLTKTIAAAIMLVIVGVSVAACGNGKVDVPAVGDHAGGNSAQPAN
jgi:hypothetical protein